MVEINNQRKAFLDMRAGGNWWTSENQKSWLWTSLQAESYLLIYPITLKTGRQQPKTQINRRRTLPASFPLVGCLPQAAWPERLLPKSQDAVALQQIKERGALYLWLIVVISSNRPQQYLGHLPGAGYGRLEHKGWQPDCNAMKCWTHREIDEGLTSRLSPLWLSASSSACHGLLIITVITPLPTKPSATKMPENWSWRRQLLTCRCVSVMLLRSMQNTRRS